MNIFTALFGKAKQLKKGGKMSYIELFTPRFSGQSDPRLNDTFMSAVEAHARHASKFCPVVYQGEEPSKAANKRKITQLLSLRPNKVMNAPTFWEKVAERYYSENNVFIYLDWDYTSLDEPLRGLWVLDPSTIEVRKDENGEALYFRFVVDGQVITTGMENIAHIARNVNADDMFGNGNKAIDMVLRVIQTNYEGIEQAIKTSAFLRFIVQSTTPLTDAAKAQRSKDFADQYLGKDATGVAYIDSAQQIIQINSQGKYCNAEELALFDAKIYKYLGINEKIITASFNEDEWQSYYESALEPLALKLESELTAKLFTDKEISLGIRVKIDANRLQAAALKTRATIATIYQKLPVYKPNVICDLLYLPRLENGDKEYATLNYVDANKQNSYQGVKDDPKNDNQDEQQEKDNEEEVKNDAENKSGE